MKNLSNAYKYSKEDLKRIAIADLTESPDETLNEIIAHLKIEFNLTKAEKNDLYNSLTNN